MNGYKLYKGVWVYDGDLSCEQKLSKQKMKKILKGGGMLVRNCYDFDCVEKTSFWQIVKDSFPTEEELSKSTRANLRRAFLTYDYRLISKDEFLKWAYPVYKDAMLRYGYKESVIVSKDRFILNYGRMDEKKNEFWGGFCKETGEFAMWEHVAINEITVEMKSEKVSTKFMKHNPTYGLNYTICQHYLKDNKFRYVCAGWRTLTNHSNVQDFLENKLKFRKAYCELQIQYVWWLKIIINILFPFRNWIVNNKIKALLNMAAIEKNMY